MLGAEVGPNPLPPLGRGQEEGPYDPAKYPGFSDQMLRDMAYGHPANHLPYTMQDCYSRELKERDFAGAVCRHARSLPVHQFTAVRRASGRLLQRSDKSMGMNSPRGSSAGRNCTADPAYAQVSTGATEGKRR